MRPVAQGRPGTEVIPTGWAAAHRPTMGATHRVTIVWRKPGVATTGAFDPETLSKPTTAKASYATGPARVQVLPALAQERVVAEDQVHVVGYQVTVDVDATDYQINDVGMVAAIDDDADPTLLGKTLTVKTVQRGSEAFERVLHCVEYLG